MKSFNISAVPKGSILIAKDFTPSMTSRIKKENVSSGFADIKDSKRMVFRQKDGKRIEMSVRPVRIKEEKTQAALILMRDLEPIAGEFLNK